MNQKNLVNILVAVIIVLTGIVAYFSLVKKSEPIAQQPITTLQPNTETPLVEANVTEQPVFLVAAYSKNGKNYIDVDYVELLYGEAGARAKLEDGNCEIPNCEDPNNGWYARNRNPKIRTFEVSPNVYIEDNGIPNRPIQRSFNDLNIFIGKSLTEIDIKNSIVTKIARPYHP